MCVNDENANEVAWELATRAASEMAAWTPPDGDVGLRRVAEAIHELFVAPPPTGGD
jgi:hypothetical protein